MTTATNEGATSGATPGTEGTQQGTEGTTNTNTAVRPDNVPEKFWNAETGTVNTEALLSSYRELETKQGATPKAEGDNAGAAEGETPLPPPTVTNVEAYNTAVNKATEELTQGGAISDETYAALEKAGVTRQQVDTYVEGQQAIFTLRLNSMQAEAGGADAYDAMLAWAATGTYTKDEAAAFNAAVFGPDATAAKAAVQNLKQRYEKEMGNEGRIVTGENAGGKTPGGYTTKTEWLTDIRKPEYKTDAGFRQQVAAKLEIAMKNGVSLGVSAVAQRG